eukprot:5427364-Amphidinium_carterae.2
MGRRTGKKQRPNGTCELHDVQEGAASREQWIYGRVWGIEPPLLCPALCKLKCKPPMKERMTEKPITPLTPRNARNPKTRRTCNQRHDVPNLTHTHGCKTTTIYHSLELLQLASAIARHAALELLRLANAKQNHIVPPVKLMLRKSYTSYTHVNAGPHCERTEEHHRDEVQERAMNDWVREEATETQIEAHEPARTTRPCTMQLSQEV